MKRAKHKENGCLSSSYRVLRNSEYLPLDGSEKLPGKAIPKNLRPRILQFSEIVEELVIIAAKVTQVYALQFVFTDL